MITRILIRSYRCFDDLCLEPNRGLNLVIGANESGKSTLLEAVALALTGKVNGRWAREELNPFWFNMDTVESFFEAVEAGNDVALPEILVEIYFDDETSAVHRGVHNSRSEDCPGISLRIAPASEFSAEIQTYLEQAPPRLLPVEYYEVDWKDFSDDRLTRRPKTLRTSFIDSRTIRSTSGVDHHTREMLSENLDAKERAELSVASRTSRQALTDGLLAEINERIAAASGDLHDREIGLQMDQSSRASWEGDVVPQVERIPFAMAGQGQQASIKVALAMNRTTGSATTVLIEEPENHLSHTSLTRLLSRIEKLADNSQQLFVATHNSFVTNRLGLDRALLFHASKTAKLAELDKDTVDYFRRLPDYDTLRLVLAEKILLVEGPSDAIVFERAFKDATGALPAEVGVDVFSMGGLAFPRAFAVCAAVDRACIGLQDNDDRPADEVRERVDAHLEEGKRELFVSDRELGPTLESQLIAANDEPHLRRVLDISDSADLATWMKNNKTSAALRIFDHAERIQYPDYIARAIERLQ